MKLLFLMSMFVCTYVGFAQTNKQSNTPVQILYGERTPDERRHGPIVSGVLNMRVLNDLLPTYPQKAKDQKIQGRVEVQLLVNEDGLNQSCENSRKTPKLIRGAMPSSPSRIFEQITAPKAADLLQRFQKIAESLPRSTRHELANHTRIFSSWK